MSGKWKGRLAVVGLVFGYVAGFVVLAILFPATSDLLTLVLSIAWTVVFFVGGQRVHEFVRVRKTGPDAKKRQQ